VNCLPQNEINDFDESDYFHREVAVWNDINRAFSEPITANDSSADYVTTQILAELFKNEGYDGIAYKSSLGEGYNTSLFDPSSAEIISCSLFSVRSETGVFLAQRNINHSQCMA